MRCEARLTKCILSEYTQQRTVPAPAYSRAGLAGVAEGAEIELRMRMEAVSEGVLVTATALARESPGSAPGAWNRSAIRGGQRPGTVRLDSADGGPAWTLVTGTLCKGTCSTSSRSCTTRSCSRCPWRRSAGRTALGCAWSAAYRSPMAGPGHRHDPAIDPRWASLQQVGLPARWPRETGPVQANRMAPGIRRSRGRRIRAGGDGHERERPAVASAANRTSAVRTKESDVAVPKRRMSRSNTRSRRAQWKATAPALVSCPQCREPRAAAHGVPDLRDVQPAPGDHPQLIR